MLFTQLVLEVVESALKHGNLALLVLFEPLESVLVSVLQLMKGLLPLVFAHDLSESSGHVFIEVLNTLLRDLLLDVISPLFGILMRGLKDFLMSKSLVDGHFLALDCCVVLIGGHQCLFGKLFLLCSLLFLSIFSSSNPHHLVLHGLVKLDFLALRCHSDRFNALLNLSPLIHLVNFEGGLDLLELEKVLNLAFEDFLFVLGNFLLLFVLDALLDDDSVTGLHDHVAYFLVSLLGFFDGLCVLL